MKKMKENPVTEFTDKRKQHSSGTLKIAPVYL